MKLQDREQATIALYFVYVAYQHAGYMNKEGEGYRMMVFSKEGHEQYFRYDDKQKLQEDLDVINKWIHSREI